MKKADLKRVAERLEKYLRLDLDWNTRADSQDCECGHRLYAEDRFCSRCGVLAKRGGLDPDVMAEIEAALKYALRGIK